MKYIKPLSTIVMVLSIFWVLFIFFISIPPQPFSDPLWEIVPTPDSSAKIMRMPVPHGWIVTYKSLSRSIVYVPDEKHEWKIK
jgi:hypothetical protein